MEDHFALYSFRDDPTIIIDSVVVVWDREKAYKQLEDRAVYKEVPNSQCILVNTMIKELEKIRLCGDLSSDTPNYVHKCLQNLTGRPVTLHCDSYTENISSLLN